MQVKSTRTGLQKKENVSNQNVKVHSQQKSTDRENISIAKKENYH